MDLMDDGTKVSISSSDCFNAPAAEALSLCEVGLLHLQNGAVIFGSQNVSISGCLIPISIPVLFIRIACHTASRSSLQSPLFLISVLYSFTSF